MMIKAKTKNKLERNGIEVVGWWKKLFVCTFFFLLKAFVCSLFTVKVLIYILYIKEQVFFTVTMQSKMKFYSSSLHCIWSLNLSSLLFFFFSSSYFHLFIYFVLSFCQNEKDRQLLGWFTVGRPPTAYLNGRPEVGPLYTIKFLPRLPVDPHNVGPTPLWPWSSLADHPLSCRGVKLNHSPVWMSTQTRLQNA